MPASRPLRPQWCFGTLKKSVRVKLSRTTSRTGDGLKFLMALAQEMRSGWRCMPALAPFQTPLHRRSWMTLFTTALFRENRSGCLSLSNAKKAHSLGSRYATLPLRRNVLLAALLPTSIALNALYGMQGPHGSGQYEMRASKVFRQRERRFQMSGRIALATPNPLQGTRNESARP
jgi:hypothetical protein